MVQSPTTSPGPAEESSPAQNRRKRSSAACQRCRKRKQKCDGKHPVCTPCAAVKAHCVPSERLVIRVDPNCECESLRARVRQLEQHIAHLEGQPGNTQPCPLSLDHGRILRPSFPQTTGADTSFQSSPWHLWKGIIAPDNTETQVYVVGAGQVPLDDNCRQGLIDVFFIKRWPQNPIIHQKSFLLNHYLPYSKGEACTDGCDGRLSSFQVNMVLAIGAVENPGVLAGRAFSHHDFFQVAVKDLQTLVGLSDITYVQCLLLLLIYGMNEPQSVNLWYTVGLALRLAVGVDLHRQESIAKLGKFDAEMSKRLFWSVYAMDRSLSIAMGRPLGIQDSDITMPLPLCVDDDKLDDEQQSTMLHATPQTNDVSTFIHIINLRRLNADIYNTLHSAGRTALHPQSLTAMRHQCLLRLDAWLVSSPRYHVSAATSMFQTQEWFQIAYHQAIMSLYRPSHASTIPSAFANTTDPTIMMASTSSPAAEDANTNTSIRLCADAAISLMTNYSTLYAKNNISYTFVALNALFLAAVTMLYSLRASATLRRELTREVARGNIGMFTRLIRDMSGERRKTEGERCASIVERLGEATLRVFDNERSVLEEGEEGEEEEEGGGERGVDMEFLRWFGLKMGQQQAKDRTGEGEGAEARTGIEVEDEGMTTPSVDMPWQDLVDNGFDLMGGFVCPDLFT